MKRVFGILAPLCALLLASCTKEVISAGNAQEGNGISGVIITEIDPYSDYIELFNEGTQTVSLEGCRLRRYRIKDGAEDKQTIWLGTAGVTIGPGEFLVLTYEEGKTDNTSYPLNLQNKISARKNMYLWLVNSDGKTLSTFQRGTKGIGWGEVNMPACEDDNDTEYSFSLVDDNWVLALPTPGAKNGSKAANISQVMQTVVINEISLPDSKVELYNFGSEAVTITGFELRWGRIKSGVADNQTICTIGTKSIAPGEYYTITSSIALGSYLNHNIKISLRDPNSLDGFGQKISWDEFKRGKKGDGWTGNSSLSAVSGYFSRVPDGSGDWYLSTATLGAANSTSTSQGLVPDVD